MFLLLRPRHRRAVGLKAQKRQRARRHEQAGHGHQPAPRAQSSRRPHPHLPPVPGLRTRCTRALMEQAARGTRGQPAVTRKTANRAS